MSPESAANDIPVSLRRLGTVAIAMVVVIVAVLIAWASFAKLDQGAIAPGEIIPAGRSKTVQHLDGGIIRAIHVRDGDEVASGQLLLELEDVDAKAQLAIVATDEAAQAALVNRLIAERDGTPLPPIKVRTPSVEAQYRILEARRSTLLKEIEGAQRRIEDAGKEQASWEEKGKHLQALSVNANEEFRINQDLYNSNFISLPRLLDLKSRMSSTSAAIAENHAEAARARQKITEGEIAIAKLKGDWLNAVLEDLRRAQDAHAAAQARLAVAESRIARARITTPQAGTVNGLRFMTVGGVIPSGGVVLDITPASDQLVVEAHLSPDEIDNVRVKLPARVRLSAYKARWHFALKGTVTQISSDTFKDERTGVSFYKVRVEIPESELQGADRVALVPGMLAQVEFVAGQRSVLRYILDPVIHSFQRAFMEK